MTTVESRAKGGKCTVGIVSCRSDVIPFFEHMGYEVSNLWPYNDLWLFSNQFCVQYLFTPYHLFQKMISKSIKEVGKLYPEDLGEKVITRNDIELVIMMKKKEVDDYWTVDYNNISHICHIICKLAKLSQHRLMMLLTLIIEVIYFLFCLRSKMMKGHITRVTPSDR